MSKIRYLLASALVVASAASASAQVGGDAERMSRIEAQMRNLTGQIETLGHTLAELQQQLKRMQDDNEFRFKSLETATAGPKVVPPPAAKPAVGPAPAGAPGASAAAPPAAGGSQPAKQPAAVASAPAAPAAALPAAGAQPQAKLPAAVASAPAAAPVAAPAAGADAIGALAVGSAPPLPAPGTQGPGAPPRPLGTVTIPAPSAATVGPAAGTAAAPGAPADQPLDLSALAKGGGIVDGTPLPQAQQVPSVPVDQKAVASIAPSGDPQVDYKKAYEFFVAGQYAASESAFRQFLAAYPSDDRASDANYWLGQTLYSRGMYREAALEFVNGHKLYPKSVRAPDTMLLLGKSLAGIPERSAACQTFAAALKQYPQMSPSLKSRVVSEQANAGC